MTIAFVKPSAAIAMITAITLSIGLNVTHASAAPDQCPRTSPSQNIATTKQWVKALNDNQWKKFDALLSEDFDRSLLDDVIIEKTGNADEIAAWQLVKKDIPNLRVRIDAISAGNNTSSNLPYATQDSVMIVGYMTGNLTTGQAVTIRYGSMVFFKCGLVHSEFAVEDAPDIVNEALKS